MILLQAMIGVAMLAPFVFVLVFGAIFTVIWLSNRLRRDKMKTITLYRSILISVVLTIIIMLALLMSIDGKNT
jgi:uncharacterized membrane protein